MHTLAVLLLFSAFLLTRASRLKSAVHILLLQSAMVAGVCAVEGLETGSTHMLMAAFLTVVIKAGLIPYALFRITSRLSYEREVNPILSSNASSLSAAAAVVLTYFVIDRTLPGVLNPRRDRDFAGARVYRADAHHHQTAGNDADCRAYYNGKRPVPARPFHYPRPAADYRTGYFL